MKAARTRRSFTLAAAAVVGGAVTGSAPLAAAPRPGGQTPGSAWRRGGAVRLRVSSGGDDAYFYGLAWRSDSARLASRLNFGPGVIIEAQGGKKLGELPAPDSAPQARGITYVPNTDLLVLGGPSRGEAVPAPIALKIVNGSSGELLQEVNGLIDPSQPLDPRTPLLRMGDLRNVPADSIEYSDLTGKIVIRPNQGTFDLEAFDTATWQPEFWQINDHSYGPTFALRPTVAEAAMTLDNGGTQIIDLQTGKRKFTPEALPRQYYTVEVTSYKYSKNGRFLIASTGLTPVGSYDGRLFVFDCDSGYRRVASFGKDFNYVSCVAIHPDSSIFVVVGEGVAYFYSLDEYVCFAQMRLPLHSLDAAFSPDGSTLACSDVGSRQLLLIEPR